MRSMREKEEKTMMKKRIAQGIALVSATAMLVGCGSGGKSSSETSESKDGKVTIKFSAWDEIPDSVFEAFNKEHPDIKVDYIRIPGDDYSQKINQMIAGNTAPDVMLAYETDLPKFAKAGAILDLDDKLSKSSEIDSDDFIPAVKELNETTDGTYGLPWCYASELLFYNKDMFDAAGVSYPTAEWTWDDYENAAKQLTVKDGSKTTQWGTDALSFGGIWYSLAGQAGDAVVKDGKLALDDGMKKALEFQNKLTNEDKVCPQPESGSSVSDLFASGQAAMCLNGSWMTSVYKDVDFKWDITTLPKGERAYNSLHTGFYTINAKSKKADAAWTFIEFMMGKEGQTITSKWLNNPSALKSIAAEGAYRNGGDNGPENWEAFDAAGEEGKVGYTTINTAVTNNLINQFNSYLLGNISLDDVMDEEIPKANKELE